MPWRNCSVSTQVHNAPDRLSGVVLVLMLGAFMTHSALAEDDPGRPPVVFDDLPIMDQRWVTLEALTVHITQKNPSVNSIYLSSLYHYYKDECLEEGVSHLVALAQMVHETDYLLFSGAVSPLQYNYAGLGSTSQGVSGLRFRSMQIGIRAHVQHLKAYGSTEPIVQEIVDPRFSYVRRGSAPTVRALVGRWAMDAAYGEKLLAHAANLASGEPPR